MKIRHFSCVGCPYFRIIKVEDFNETHKWNFQWNLSLFEDIIYIIKQNHLSMYKRVHLVHSYLIGGEV